MKEAHELVTTGTPKHHDIPCATVLTAYSVLSPVNGSFATVVDGITSANLTPASRRQDHTILPSAISITRLTMRCVHRIPRPTLVTIAKRPSGGTGCAKTITHFGKTEVKFWPQAGERSQVPELSAGIGFCAHADLWAKRPAGEARSQKIGH
jgi:hypothetical protein